MDYDHNSGFTLVEMMMVLVIIGLMTSAVVFNLPGKTDGVQDYTDRLLIEFNQAGQNSLMTGQTHSVNLSQDGYNLSAFDGENWTIIQDGFWPEGVRIIFEKDQNSIDLPQTPAPLIMFEPTGGSTVFSLRLYSSQGHYNLTSHGDGRVNLEVRR